MSTGFVRGALVGFVCAVLGGGAVALAGSGVGGVFNLGQSNTVDEQTKLSGSVANPQLRVENASTSGGARGIIGRITSASAGAGSAGLLGGTASTDPGSVGVIAQNTGGGPALSAVVNAGAPPLKVNSDTKVANLNADQVDGLDSATLVRSFPQTPSLARSGYITSGRSNIGQPVVLANPLFQVITGPFGGVCSLQVLNTSGSTWMLTRQTFPTGGSPSGTDTVLGNNSADSALGITGSVHWQAWVPGVPDPTAVVITIDASVRNPPACDAAATAHVGGQ